MLESKDFYFFGYSGHALVVIDVAFANGFHVKGYYDKAKNKSALSDINFMGDESIKEEVRFDKNAVFFPAIGENTTRKSIVQLIEKLELNQISLIHPSAVVSSSATYGLSTLIGANSVVNSSAVLGQGCIVNSGALVEHECRIGNFVHLAPGAVLAGDVMVGNNAFIGAGAVIKQGVKIGANTIVGAGSIVLRDIPRGETWVGNPAKRMKR